MVPSANNTSLLDLSQLPKARKYFIAYSGGMDSTALLHALIQHPAVNNKRLIAVHINHNIHHQAIKWRDHCAAQCKFYGIEFIAENVKPKDNSENACRQERIRVFTSLLSEHDCLLTGHHLNDQIETVLFRLLRGTGLHGLSGMNQLSHQLHFQIYRPLLKVNRLQITDYIKKHQLHFIEDPSNQQNHYSRNYLRNQIIPMIENHFPDAVKNILLTSQNLNKSSSVFCQLIGKNNPVEISRWQDPNQLSTFLYHWLTNQMVDVVSHRALLQFADDCIKANKDKLPELKTPDWQLKYWNKHVYLLGFTPQIKPQRLSTTLKNNVLQNLPMGFGTIKIISEEPLSLDIFIEFQKNSEKIKLSKNQSRQKLKNLFQAHKIPPWERAVMPYLYFEGELMAVGNTFISVNFKKLLDNYNAEYQWLSPCFLL